MLKKAIAAVVSAVVSALVFVTPVSADHWSPRTCPPGWVERSLRITWYAPDWETVVIGPRYTVRWITGCSPDKG